MQDKELYEKLLGLTAPWSVQEVDLQMSRDEGHIETGPSTILEVSVPGM